MLSPSTEVLFLLGASGARAGVRLRPLVDGAHRRLAARRGPARALQRDVDPPAGAGRRRALWRRPDGDHLHAGRRRRGSAQRVAGVYLPAMPIIGGAMFSVGASAPIFGLLGALVYYGRRTGNSHAGQAGLQYALFLGVFGLIFPGVDNWAHAGGFAGGFLASLVLDPLHTGAGRPPGAGARLPRAHRRRPDRLVRHCPALPDAVITASCPGLGGRCRSR